MNYKLLWQLEREENYNLRRELKVQKAINSGINQGVELLEDQLKELKDQNDTLIKSVERERRDRYVYGIR